MCYNASLSVAKLIRFLQLAMLKLKYLQYIEQDRIRHFVSFYGWHTNCAIKTKL